MARNYNMSDSELRYKAGNVAGYVTRDIAEFDEYGITATAVTEFLDKVEAFAQMPSDEVWQSNIILATAAKDAKVEEVYDAIRKIMVRVEAKFNQKSPMYLAISPGRMEDIKDKHLVDAVNTFVLKCTPHIAALASTGVTAAKITELTALGLEVKALVDAKKALVDNRNIAQVAREMAGNEIYDTMMDWCRYGQIIWRKTNSAKYDDYIVYADDVPQTPTDPPTGLQVNMMTLVLTWLAVAGATGYKVKYKFPADSGSYVDAHDGILHTTEFTLAPQPESFKVVVLANNAAGLSDPSAELLVAPALAAPGGFVYDHVAGKFVWVMVSGVTFYRLEASYDGGATWQEISAQDFVTGEYVWSPPPGIFRLRGELNGGVSAWVYATIA